MRDRKMENRQMQAGSWRQKVAGDSPEYASTQPQLLLQFPVPLLSVTCPRLASLFANPLPSL
jgi:hypothetical protein